MGLPADEAERRAGERGWTKVRALPPGAIITMEYRAGRLNFTVTDAAVLDRPLDELPTTYVKCLMDGEDPNDDVAELLKSARWDLVEMETGHWPMFSQPHEMARVLLRAAAR